MPGGLDHSYQRCVRVGNNFTADATCVCFVLSVEFVDYYVVSLSLERASERSSSVLPFPMIGFRSRTIMMITFVNKRGYYTISSALRA